MAYNILIVDDSATTRGVIKRTIKLAGVPFGQLLEAANGKLALEVMAANTVDLVLADLNMPEMGGVEMTHIMRADLRFKDIPVVVISAEPNVHKLEELKKDNIRGYIRKPFTPEGVRDIIQQTLGVCNA